MQTIKPAKNQVFAKPSEAEKTTKSGFILSDKASYKPLTAEVINVGSDVKDYKQKDTIIYKSYATTEVKLDDVDYLLIDQDDVLGTVLEVA